MTCHNFPQKNVCKTIILQDDLKITFKITTSYLQHKKEFYVSANIPTIKILQKIYN